jgi:hypothetical protein
MKKLLLAGWLLAVAVAGATYPVVKAIARTGTDVYLLDPFSNDMVMVNRDPTMLDLPSPTDPSYPRKVRELYGNSPETTDRVVFVSKERFLHPEELPSMTLLPVDKSKGENPLQVKSLYFFAKYVVASSLAGGAILFILWCVVRRRSTAGAPA